MAKIENLLAGFKGFQKEYFEGDNRLYASMKDGQPAKTLMIACCDSRVDPANLTGCNPGDLFIVRNVANLVPPCEDDGHYHGTSAALEFAVNSLNVENIIVMGHANCGGINALWEGHGGESSQFIQPWVSIAKRAKDKVKLECNNLSPEKQLIACEQEAILVSLENLLSFSFIKERVELGVLSIHGWYFDIKGGDILTYEPQQNKFISVS
jgi:carbonic anhydrase